MLENEELIALDIETSNGFGQGSLDARDPNSFIALVQLATEDGEISLRRWNDETLSLLKQYQSEGYRFIIHNASFELDWFLVKSGLRLEKIWCTMLASQVLNAGKELPDEATLMSGRLESKNLDYLGNWNPLLYEIDSNISKSKSGKFSHTAQATVYRYADKAIIQKDQGNSDWAADPLTPEQIRYAEDDVRYLIKAAKNQWEFIKKLGMEKVAEIEMATAIVVNDMKYHGVKVDKDKWRESASDNGEVAAKLEIELNKRLGTELATREGNLSVFGTFLPKSFNVGSPAQLASFFGLEKADESVLKGVDHPAIADILTYKEYSKLANTYGDSYLKYIQSDGRIHSGLVQARTATGRFSSVRPALQTIPPDMLKSLVTTEEDKVLLFADYSAVESRILAYLAGDRAFIDSVNSKDIHSENARKIFKIPHDVSVDPELRRKAKVLSFSSVYGVSGVGLYNRGMGDSVEEAQQMLDDFFSAFPGVQKFLQTAAAYAITRRYSQNISGRRRWYEVPAGLTKEEVDKAYKGFARQAMNFPVQSASADITKTALCDLYEYLQETGYGYAVLTIHDSIICELYEATAGEATMNIKRIMEEAGPKIVPGIITPVDVEVGHKEKRTCAVTGLVYSTFSHTYKDGVVVRNDVYLEPRLVAVGYSPEKDIKEFLSSLSEVWREKNQDIVNLF